MTQIQNQIKWKTKDITKIKTYDIIKIYNKTYDKNIWYMIKIKLHVSYHKNLYFCNISAIMNSPKKAGVQFNPLSLRFIQKCIF